MADIPLSISTPVEINLKILLASNFSKYSSSVQVSTHLTLPRERLESMLTPRCSERPTEVIVSLSYGISYMTTSLPVFKCRSLKYIPPLLAVSFELFPEY